MASLATLQVPPLTKRSMTELVDKAKRKGLQPGDYAKLLIEEGLAFEREAETSSFAEIMATVRDTAGDVDDAEIVKLVKRARARGHASGRRKTR